jgi:hypothetical protein
MNVGSTSVVLPTCLAGRFLGWMLPKQARIGKPGVGKGKIALCLQGCVGRQFTGAALSLCAILDQIVAVVDGKNKFAEERMTQKDRRGDFPAVSGEASAL